MSFFFFFPQGTHFFFFNFIAVVTIFSDFGDQEKKACHCFHCFPIYLHEVMGLDAIILVF